MNSNDAVWVWPIHHGIFAAPGIEIEAPRPECERSKVLSQCGRTPRFAAVNGNIHRPDAIAAIPGETVDRDLAGLHFGTVAVAGNQGIHHNFGDRRGGFILLRDEARDDWKFADRNAVGRFHPEASQRLGQRHDRVEVLHPIGAGPARHDQPRREAIEMW